LRTESRVVSVEWKGRCAVMTAGLAGDLICWSTWSSRWSADWRQHYIGPTLSFRRDKTDTEDLEYGYWSSGALWERHRFP